MLYLNNKIKLRESIKMKKTVIDLFSGVGGFRLGLERSSHDWKTVWANQYEPARKSQWAFECYVENFCENKNVDEIYNFNKTEEDLNPWNNIDIKKVKDEAINEFSNVDIAKVETEDIPNHTLLCGGFPCQDYSVATTQAEGIKGKKGVLWWQIERVVKAKKPNFILLENVNRLIKSHKGRDFGIMLASLNNLGYTVEWRVINAADYGYRQRRRRVFIFASRNDNKYTKKVKDKNVEKILTENGFFSTIFKVSNSDANDTTTTKLDSDLVKMTNKFKFKFQNTGFMTDGKVWTKKVEPKEAEEKSVIRDILEKNVDEKYYLSDDEMEKWEYMKGSKEIPRTAKNGHKYVFREGAIAFPDPIDKPARTILTSESSRNRSTHIIKDPETGRLRKLTPAECDQLNYFPKDWTKTKTMSHSFRYFAMGNALVVGLIQEMGEQLGEIIDKENEDN